jgi:hypothetical protein
MHWRLFHGGRSPCFGTGNWSTSSFGSPQPK